MHPDFKRIQLCAQLSALAYTGTAPHFAALGLRVAHTIHSPATDTQGFILHNDSEIFVVLRGTTSFHDWKTNIKIRKEAPNWAVPSLVHRGFLAAMQSVIISIKRAIQMLRLDSDKRLTITGHSLGGALAMLVALDLEDAYEPVHQVITFGQPRVGDRKFRAYFNTMLGGRTIRVVNQIDAVPRAPFWLRGYRHAGRTHFFIDATGQAEINPHLFTLLVNDAFCVARDWLHLRWVQIGGFRIPVPFRISAASNHTMQDYIAKLEAYAGNN